MDATPRRRWEAAVAARPLEAPRALPAPYRAMAATITGAAHPPRFTTGPATRHALAAAGALGATTGSVVHLPGPPSPATAAVLAHELTHARRPVRRPRFLLAGLAGAVDDDERAALAAGGLRQGGIPNDAGGMSAGIVDRLPVGSGMGGVTDVAARVARATLIEAGASTPSPGPVMGNAGPTTQEAVPAPAAAPVVQGGAPPGAAAGGKTTAGPQPLDVERVVEAVEERLLREIERRGGRWAGVF
ncbi:eCIS core domain-containing protein [Phytohabitans sp. LJ34]